MKIRCNRTLLLGLVLFATTTARADWLELTAEGEQKIQAIQDRDAGSHNNIPILQYHLVANAGSTHGFVRGMVIVTRDNVGQLAFTGDKASDFNDKPDQFFKFRPYKWITQDASGKVSWVDYEFEWKWVASVKNEVDTLDDLCEMMSWRCMGPNGADPTPATTKAGCRWVLTTLDPNNSLDLNNGGGQATQNNVHEGYCSRYLLYGTPNQDATLSDADRVRAWGKERVARIKDCRKGTGPVGQYGAFDYKADAPTYNKGNVKYCPTDSDFWDDTPDNIIHQLVTTMARCKKANGQGRALYPIPYGGALLDCSRTVAQFLCSDLAGVPVQDATQEGKGKRIRAFAFRARAALLSILDGATPEKLKARRARSVQLRPNEPALEAQLRVTPVDDEMPVDVFDLADAALDVLLMRDGSGLVKPYNDDMTRISQTLLRLASASSRFNQEGARNLWPQDPLGEKALQILMALVDPQTQGNIPNAQQNADSYREKVVNAMADATNQSYANAARYVLCLSNGADPAELQREVSALFEMAIGAGATPPQSYYESPPASGYYTPASSNDPRQADAIATIKALAAKNGDAAAAVQAQLDDLKKRQAAGTGSMDEK